MTYYEHLSLQEFLEEDALAQRYSGFPSQVKDHMVYNEIEYTFLLMNEEALKREEDMNE